MKSAGKHPLRTAGRLLWLAAALGWSALAYLPMTRGTRGPARRAARARWLQYTCRQVMRVFHLEVSACGPAPARGLLVCNHLSYLDIVVLGAQTPAVFISKNEVAGWPVFGWFARMSGTLFVRRERRGDVGRMGDEIKAALADGAVVVLFPEGTSSDGQTVLPFKSALLEPAMDTTHPLAAAHIQYSLTDGNPADEVCYWRDMTLAPHLINLLSKERIQARLVTATDVRPAAETRKDLARQLHETVMQLRAKAMIDN